MPIKNLTKIKKDIIIRLMISNHFTKGGFMKNNQELHKNIIKIMKQQNISQAKLARELNVSRSDISILLKSLSLGKSITTSKLFLIAHILNVDFTMITDN